MHPLKFISHFIVDVHLSVYTLHASVPAKLVEVYLDLRTLAEEHVRVSDFMLFH